MPWSHARSTAQLGKGIVTDAKLSCRAATCCYHCFDIFNFFVKDQQRIAEFYGYRDEAGDDLCNPGGITHDVPQRSSFPPARASLLP